MTDDNGGLFGALFGQPSPEQIAAMEARRAAHFMSLEDAKNKLEGLFGELTLEQLTSLREMLYTISNSDNTVAMADYWTGWASAVLKYKHGVCSSCGVDHSEEGLMDLVKKNGPDDQPAGDEPQVSSENDVALDKFRDMTPEELALMKEYHLDDARIEGTNELVGFICTGIEGVPGGCGLVYVSIEDRMLKKPEECHGCFNKAAHG